MYYEFIAKKNGQHVTKNILEEAVDAIFEGMDRLFNSAKSDLNSLKKEMNKRFDKVDDRLEKVEYDVTLIKRDAKDIKEDISVTPTLGQFHRLEKESEDLKGLINIHLKFPEVAVYSVFQIQ